MKENWKKKTKEKKQQETATNLELALSIILK